MRILLPLVLAGALAASDSDYAPFDGRAMLGINMTPPSQQTQQNNGTDPSVGVEANRVYPGTAADRMGIKPGDLIVAINGGGIGSMNDMRNEVALTGVGGAATVEVLRNGQRLVMNDRLSEWPKDVPYEPIDEASEKRFRDWQARRLDRTQRAVAALRKQVEDAERRASDQPVAAKTPVSPAQAMSMPASTALASLPAFRVRLIAGHDTPAPLPAEAIPARIVAWDARVLLGTDPVVIF
jgi:hypothetical protein